MSTRASNARNVRQRKLNTKQPLRIVREDQVEETLDDEAQRHIPQVETGVEKGEEVEYHLQAVINSHVGPKDKAQYIPTPETVKAQDVDYEHLYPKKFSQPATYIRFSSTVEDCIGVPYCMTEADEEFLGQLNEGKDVDGQPLKDKSGQCSEDAFEEVISFFEESTQRLQPFSTIDESPLLELSVMEHAREEDLSSGAQRFIKPIYHYWVSRKGSRPMMPAIKVRVLDTTNEADDADPYVCFRRREVRQTRKTRGRDAQVVEKLKKLRTELESARSLVQMVKHREELNEKNLKISRQVFEERKRLKDVKIAKSIVGEKGEDEELLVNQRPVPKPKTGRDGTQPRLPPLRLRTDRAPDQDLPSLADQQADAEAHVNHTIESRKEQHRKWNQHWQDRTWDPLTPPPESADDPPRWAPLFAAETGYPTPPPSLPSRSSQDRDGDIDMTDQKPVLDDNAVAGAEHKFTFFIPPPYPTNGSYESGSHREFSKRHNNPACRIRYGRGGRMHLEVRKRKARGVISRGVVSDSESDEELEDYYPVSEAKTFDYRCALNSRARPGPDGVERKQWPSGDQTAMMAGAPQPQQQQQQQPQSSAASAGAQPAPSGGGDG